MSVGGSDGKIEQISIETSNDLVYVGLTNDTPRSREYETKEETPIQSHNAIITYAYYC